MIRTQNNNTQHKGNKLSVTFMLSKIAEGCGRIIDDKISARSKSMNPDSVARMYRIYQQRPTESNAEFILHFLML